MALPSPTYSDIPYVKHNHERQTLDIYMPAAQSSPSECSPLIMYIHGGAFKMGSKRSRFVPFRLLKKGYAIASIDYRLSGDAIFPAAIQDCKSAIRYLRANEKTYNINTEHLIVWGESAGAHCASMVGVTSGLKVSLFEDGESRDVSAEVAGVVDYYGPTDFLLMDEQAPAGCSMKHNDARSPESLYLGEQITQIPEQVAMANPITYLNDAGSGSRSLPKFFLAHGTMDMIVACGQSVIFEQALRQNGFDVVLHPVDGANHCFEGASEEQMQKLDAATDRFLERVGPRSALSAMSQV